MAMPKITVTPADPDLEPMASVSVSIVAPLHVQNHLAVPANTWSVDSSPVVPAVVQPYPATINYIGENATPNDPILEADSKTATLLSSAGYVTLSDINIGIDQVGLSDNQFAPNNWNRTLISQNVSETYATMATPTSDLNWDTMLFAQRTLNALNTLAEFDQIINGTQVRDTYYDATRSVAPNSGWEQGEREATAYQQIELEQVLPIAEFPSTVGPSNGQADMTDSELASFNDAIRDLLATPNIPNHSLAPVSASGSALFSTDLNCARNAATYQEVPPLFTDASLWQQPAWSVLPTNIQSPVRVTVEQHTGAETAATMAADGDIQIVLVKTNLASTDATAISKAAELDMLNSVFRTEKEKVWPIISRKRNRTRDSASRVAFDLQIYRRIRRASAPWGQRQVLPTARRSYKQNHPPPAGRCTARPTHLHTIQTVFETDEDDDAVGTEQHLLKKRRTSRLPTPLARSSNQLSVAHDNTSVTPPLEQQGCLPAVSIAGVPDETQVVHIEDDLDGTPLLLDEVVPGSSVRASLDTAPGSPDIDGYAIVDYDVALMGQANSTEFTVVAPLDPLLETGTVEKNVINTAGQFLRVSCSSTRWFINDVAYFS
ncbi:hypothetical protein FRB93_011450 [Tulasnella sp. JGI-2019a]|nr:hypothetical protein FRB93_011450 [Tulasnella sp. JGI-2019a]